MNAPIRNSKDGNRDRSSRKHRERRNQEEWKVVLNRPARQKRWKDKYVAGELEDTDTILEGNEDSWFTDDPEELSSE